MGPTGSDDYRARLKTVASPKRHFVLFSPIRELEDDLAAPHQSTPPALFRLGQLEPIAFNLVGALFTPDLVRPVRVQDERRTRAVAAAPIHNQAGTMVGTRGIGACTY